MSKIKDFGNKLQEKYYRTKETVCYPDNVFPGDVFHSERFDKVQYISNTQTHDFNTYSLTGSAYFATLSGWSINPVSGDLSDDIKYGRYEGLESRQWYIKDESSSDIYTYGYRPQPLANFKRDMVVFKTVYDTIEKYATLIDDTKLASIKELSTNIITQEYYPAKYFGFEGSVPMYKSETNPVSFNSTDGDDQINFMKKWVYYIRRTGNTTPKYELYGWGDKMGKTSEEDINTKFNKVIEHLGLVPSFLPKDLYTFDHIRYGIDNVFSVWTSMDKMNVINNLFKTDSTGVSHNGSNVNGMSYIFDTMWGYNTIIAKTEDMLKQEKPNATHDELRASLLKSNSGNDIYYVLKDEFIRDYPNDSKAVSTLMTLSEEELNKIRNDAFRKVVVDTSDSSSFIHMDEEKLQQTELVRNGKLQKYHVLDLALRHVDGFKIPTLDYLTDEFIASHPDNKVIFVGDNGYYCYVPTDAETYSMSTEDYLGSFDPFYIEVNSDESKVTTHLKTLPFTKEQFEKIITFSDPNYSSPWGSLQPITDYEFVSSAREVLDKKHGQRITKQFNVYSVKGSTELLIMNRVIDEIPLPYLYNYDTFIKFYNHIGYTINYPVTPTEDQITGYINSLNVNSNDTFPWSKIEEIDTLGLNAKKIYQHMAKRDIFSPDNVSSFVSIYKSVTNHETNSTDILLTADKIHELILIEDSEDSSKVIRIRDDFDYYNAAGTEKAQYDSVVKFINDNSTASSWLTTHNSNDLYKINSLSKTDRLNWLMTVLKSYADGTNTLDKIKNWLSHIDKTVTIDAEKLQKVVETNISGVQISIAHVSVLIPYGTSYKDYTLGPIVDKNNTFVAENTICRIEGHEGWLFMLHYENNYALDSGTPYLVPDSDPNDGIDDGKPLIKFLKTLS